MRAALRAIGDFILNHVPAILDYAACFVLIGLALRKPEPRIWIGAVLGYMLASFVRMVTQSLKWYRRRGPNARV